MNNLKLYEDIISSDNSTLKIQMLKKFKELCELESELDSIKSENKSNKRKINHKRFTILCKRVIPYVVSVSTAFGIMAFTEHTPFIIDKKKNVIEETKNYSEDGVSITRKNILYKDFVNGINTLHVYGDWEKTSDGYQRSYSEYDIPSLTEEEILELINNYPNIDLKLNEPLKSGIIYSEEIYDDNNIVIESHDLLNGTTVRLAEKVPSNIIDTVIFLIAIIFITYSVHEYNKSIDYKKILDDVKLVYSITDTKELEEKIKEMGKEISQMLGQKQHKKLKPKKQ